MSGISHRLLAILFVLCLAYNATGLTPPSASTATLPSASAAIAYAPDIPAPDCTHTVRAGEWLSRIAAEFHTTWPVLARRNGLRHPDMLSIGQSLDVCPGTSPPPPTPIQQVASALNPREFCRSSIFWLPHITLWATPPGCYGRIYIPNVAAYPRRPGVGWCSWWAEEMHLQYPGSQALHVPAHQTPILGAVVWFAPGVQGAGGAGHYANVIAIRGDGWLLISEENDTWRGGGFGRVDYRYVHIGPGVEFLY